MVVTCLVSTLVSVALALLRTVFSRLAGTSSVTIVVGMTGIGSSPLQEVKHRVVVSIITMLFKINFFIFFFVFNELIINYLLLKCDSY